MTVHPLVAALFLLFAGSAASAVAQSPNTPDSAARGRMVGRVLDGATGAGVPGAQVSIEGSTAVQTRTDMGGRYTLLNVAPGTHAVLARMIGYSAKTVTGVVVTAGGATRLDVTLDAAAIELTAVEVTAAAERGSVAQSLGEQRSATQIVTAISSEQIKRSPDSDAGQVMQRVSGATVQDGKYVFVRGLGERYTSASLNSARLPSPEPDRKVVPLDLFPSALLQSVVTSKTFTPEQSGDLTGAQVDLRTRDFPTGHVFSRSVSTGFNDAATFRNVLAASRVGSEWYGFAGSQRALPARVRAAGDLTGTSGAERNAIINSFRNVWSPWTETAKPNGSVGLSLGGEDIVAGRPLGYVASLTYSESQEVRRDEERSVTSTSGTVTTPLNQTQGETGTVGVLWGGLLNLSTHVSPAAKISFNNAYTRSLDNQATRSLVADEEFDQVFTDSRLALVERTMRSNQIRGEHLVGARHGVTWSVTSSGVTRYEPDRSDLRYQTAVDGSGAPYATTWWGSGQSAVRTFSDLSENSLEGAGTLSLLFGAGERQWRVKAGGAYRSVRRAADTRSYAFVNARLTAAERSAAPERIFAGGYASDSAFYLVPDLALGRYVAADGVGAGFLQLEAPLSARVRVIAGARVERWALDLTYGQPGRPGVLLRRRNADVLPALSANVQLSGAHALRLSASQTLARPEYREIAPIASRSLAGEYDVYGNSELQRALVRNLDARWEWYPSPRELISVGVFAKHFDHPIEKVIIGVAGGDALQFVNAAGASSYGVELEIRKNLFAIVPALAPLTVFANATVMRSRIEAGAVNLTNTDRPMVGQADYVLNGGVAYASASGRAATLLYNVVGPRVYEAGASPRPDAYERPRHMLDFSTQLPLFGGAVSLKLDAKNLLDSPVHITQGQVTRVRFRTGRVFSLAATWQP